MTLYKILRVPAVPAFRAHSHADTSGGGGGAFETLRRRFFFLILHKYRR
jgi:hypothetical protein